MPSSKTKRKADDQERMEKAVASVQMLTRSRAAAKSPKANARESAVVLENSGQMMADIA